MISDVMELEGPVVITEEDGALVNEATGEILGYAGSPFVLPPLDPALTASLTREEILSRTKEREEKVKEAVLWATERRAKAEARMKGVTFERDTLIAGVNERFEGPINEQKRRIDWIDATYGPAMREFTKSQLEGAKTKSVKLPWATLGYRASKGALEVTDAPTAAFTLIEEGGESAVKLTIDLGALHAAAAADPHGTADLLMRAIGDAFEVKYTEEGEAKNEAIIEKATLPSGVDVAILANQVPDELPESLVGLERKAPEDPLGKFYVSHK